MQKIIGIFVGRIECYVAENTDRMDIFGDFGSRIPFRYRPGLFAFWTCPIYLGLLRSFGPVWIYQYSKL